MSDKLRFKDEHGQDYPEWDCSKLGEYCYIQGGYAFNSNSFKTEGIPIIKIANLQEGIIALDEDSTVYYNSLDIDERFYVKQNDILIAMSGATTGKIGIYKSDRTALLNQRVGLFKNIDTNRLYYKFLKYLLETDLYKTLMSGICVAGAQPNISPKDIEEMLFNIPSIVEQQKIADFLSTVDDKIENQKEIVANWEEIKKGLIQKIFSQEIRFKDENGQDYPEWEENNLGTIGFFKTSSVDKKIYENETIVNLVNYMDVYNKKILTNQTINSLDKTSAKESQLTENSLKKGDILFTPSSETPEDIGHSVVIVEDLPSTVYSYHLVRFRPTTSRLDVEYSNYFCNNDLVRSQIVAKATGSTRFTVSIKDLNNILVKIPSINEQQKIANLLSTVDKKIECEKNILNELIELKKGLLQRIFAEKRLRALQFL